MTEAAYLFAAATVIATLGLLLAVWHAGKRADRAEAARDTAIGQRDAATAAANEHWRALRRARGELERYRRNLSEADHWATVPRETPDSNAGGHVPCGHQWCGADGAPTCPGCGRPPSAFDRPTAVLDIRTLTPVADVPTALLPQYPKGTPEYDAYASELRTELAKFVALEPPYDRRAL